jgi:ornithine--oxo-acid transaminase
MVVNFGMIEDLKEALEKDGNKIAAFMVEPIQGAAGYFSMPSSLLQLTFFI